MNTTGKHIRLRLTLLSLIFFFALAGVTLAQDVTITNLTQLVDVALSGNYSLYLPWTPWQIQAYPTDNGEPWWLDCSQMSCADLLSISTDSCATIQMHGVTVTFATLTKNILTGETLLSSGCATDVVASIAAPSGYDPSTQLGYNAWVWRQWQQVTNCLDCWGLVAGEIPPPIVTLKTRLADATQYSTYTNNEEAEAEAAAAAWAAAFSSFGTSGGSMFMGMEDDLSCVITDETSPFSVVSIAPDGSGGMTLQWQSCPDHVYVVQKESSLTPTSSWTDVAWMLGANGTTSWDDTNIVGQAQAFYQVVRANPNTLNDGIPYGWAVTYGFDPFDPNLAWEDTDGDCLNNYQEYLQGSDPTAPGPILISVGPVYAGSTTNTFTVVPNLVPLYTYSFDLPGGIIQSTVDSNFYGVAQTNLDGGDQLIFKMTPQGEATPLYTFRGTADGYYPSTPMQAVDTNFYGVCYLGGNATVSFCNGSVVGYGTVFQLTPQGVLTNLHLFAGPPEGSCPVGGVIQGTDGSFYGVTEAGGSNNCSASPLEQFFDIFGSCCDPAYGGYGTVFKLTPQGTLTTLHTFSGGSDGAFPEAALLQGSDGLLYGTTSAGNSNDGTVFKIGTNGASFATLHQFIGGTDGATPLGALIQDGTGNLYGTAYGGGANGNGTVFKVNTNGATFVTLHAFGGVPDGSYPGVGLMQSGTGNFYGTTAFGGSTAGGIGVGNGTLFTITPAGTLTTLYQFTGGADGAWPNVGPIVQSIIDGDFYGVTENDGANGVGTLFKYVPTTYTWTLSSGSFTSGQISPYIAFTTASACPVTLSVAGSSSLGCTNSGSITVTPTAPFPIANSPIEVGQTLNLSVPAVAGATYSWSGPNGFSLTNQNPTIANIQPCGAGQYCVSVLGAGCTSMPNCVSVTITTPQPTSNGPLCAGETLALSVTNITGITYAWTGPAGFASTLQNQSISSAQATNSGEYCVVTIAGGCTSTPSCVSVTIHPLPTATLSGTNIICNGGTITLEASLTGVSPWIVTWSDGVITTNHSSPSSHAITTYSTTNFTVTALSDTNCSGGIIFGSTTVVVTTNITSSVNVSNEVLVIYNSNTSFPDSLSCKNYYINHRPGFSNANVLACSCTTTGTDGFESITTANLTNQIINPIISFIQSNTNKTIHYAVLMYGMPSRVADGDQYSVQYHISHCMSDAGYTSGPFYEGSTCPFVATNYLGTTCLVTALNLATLADCTAYVDKVTSMYTGNVIISAKAAGYDNDNYYFDDTRNTTLYGSIPEAVFFQSAVLGQNPSANVTFTSNTVISSGSNVKGYVGWGTHNAVFNGAFGAEYPTNGLIAWSGSSTWWIIKTFESFNGQRDRSNPSQEPPQGDVEEWFASNGWGGTNYVNTPVGAVSDVEEPGVPANGPTYMSLWEAGFLFSECAWASDVVQYLQVIGDPLVKQ